MKNKKEIVQVFREWVDQQQEATKTAATACKALEDMPDKPSKEQVEHVNKLLSETLNSAMEVVTSFDINFDRLKYLLAEN